MHKREVTIGQNTLSIETGKLAKQADGSVIVRYGDTVVLVTACHAANAARGHRLPAADGRLPRVHLRVGPDPRRLLQARGQAEREGSADQPRHRPADPAAVPARLALRDAGHRAGALGRHRERLRRPGDHRRLGRAGAVGDPLHEDDRRRARRPRRTASTSSTRRSTQRKAEPPRPRRRRQQRRPRDGRGRREGGRRRRRWSRRSRPRTRRSSKIVDGHRRPGAGGRARTKLTVPSQGVRPRLLPRGRGEGAGCRSPRRCASRTSSRTTSRVDQLLDDARGRASPRRRSSGGSRRRRSSRS